MKRLGGKHPGRKFAAVAVSAAQLPVLGPAPAWSLKDLDGKEVSFAQFKGKTVVVDFWATW
ncbi:MAG: redoxin domain-containing protein [Opitutaceae bacterium]|nr:redoxin domain-containing protein [Opitutaceae bacterium]